MPRVTVVDAGGERHTLNLSSDPRGIAMDGGASGFNLGFRQPSKDTVGRLPTSTRRPARDDDPGVPQQSPRDAAAVMINEILDSCEDPDGVLADVQQARGQSERSDESGMDAGTEYPQRPGYVPSVSGKTAPKLQMDSALAMDKRDPMLAGFLGRIRLGGR
jgi:hypothetical protein